MKGFGGYFMVDGFLYAILGILFGFVALTEGQGNVHFVGGRDGWVLSPSESYNHWAGNARFQVNDTLVFSYEKRDSVLVVNETDYNTCNPNNPIQTLRGGYSIVQLDRSGPFYFISGIADQCYKGHKMVIVVMAVRNNMPNVTPAISPAPSISVPPIGSILPPNAPPDGALSPSPAVALAPPPVPGAGSGVGIAPVPMSGGPSIGIAPASGPAMPGKGIGPASAPNVPAQDNEGSAVSIGVYWIVSAFGFVILQVGLN